MTDVLRNSSKYKGAPNDWQNKYYRSWEEFSYGTGVNIRAPLMIGQLRNSTKHRGAPDEWSIT